MAALSFTILVLAILSMNSCFSMLCHHRCTLRLGAHGGAWLSADPTVILVELFEEAAEIYPMSSVRCCSYALLQSLVEEQMRRRLYQTIVHLDFCVEGNAH